MSTAVALTINVHEANKTLPAALEARLQSTPTKSPDELAEALRVHEAKSSALRKAHLDAVRDRAARDMQRAAEAIARKLRLAAAKKEHTLRKIDAAATKCDAKREATEAERAERKSAFEARKAAVAEARKAAVEAKRLRAAELASAEAAASAKHAKVVDLVQAKGAASAKHALAVAQAHKEKEVSDAVCRGEALADRLHAAGVRRELFAESSSSSSSTPTSSRLHKVRNDDKVLCEMRKVLHESAMAKAEAKRLAHLTSIASKARGEVDKVASVVTANKAAATGLDAATAEARSAMHERLWTAEVNRLAALKAKVDATRTLKGDTVSVIFVRMDDVLTLRSPPASLLTRLSAKKGALLATAPARQAGAASRRALIKQTKLMAAAKHAGKVAAAAIRRGKAHAALSTSVRAKAARSAVVVALSQGARAATLATHKKHTLAFAAKRAQIAEGVARVGTTALLKGDLAAERKAKALRTVAKAGVVAVRAAASKSRRDAARASLLSRAEVLSARCAAAEAKVAELRAAKVELARKRMVARHPKREVADMEIKEHFSDRDA